MFMESLVIELDALIPQIGGTTFDSLLYLGGSETILAEVLRIELIYNFSISTCVICGIC